ncbi:MAG: YbaN family protein [Gammaproteobacteria bacterium]
MQPPDDTQPPRAAANTGMRAALLRVAGFALFGLGFVGMFVPLLPTTIFWILAVWAFAGSSPAWRARILDHPQFGAAVGEFVDHRVLRRRGKCYAILGIYGGLGLSTWLLHLSAPWALGLGLALLPLAIYLITRAETPTNVAPPR